MPYHIISYHIIPYYPLPYHIMLYHVIICLSYMCLYSPHVLCPSDFEEVLTRREFELACAPILEVVESAVSRTLQQWKQLRSRTKRLVRGNRLFMSFLMSQTRPCQKSAWFKWLTGGYLHWCHSLVFTSTTVYFNSYYFCVVNWQSNGWGFDKQTLMWMRFSRLVLLPSNCFYK